MQRAEVSLLQQYCCCGNSCCSSHLHTLHYCVESALRCHHSRAGDVTICQGIATLMAGKSAQACLWEGQAGDCSLSLSISSVTSG